MKTKPIPIIITLAAAFISCAISIYQKVEFGDFVLRLLIVVVVFLVLGTIIKILLDSSFVVMEEQPVEQEVEESVEGGTEDFNVDTSEDYSEETPSDSYDEDE